MFKKRKLTMNLMLLSMVPVLLLGLLVTATTSMIIYFSLCKEVNYSLDMLIHTTFQNYELLYPGEFHTDGTHLYRGNVDVKDLVYVLDDIKDKSAADATIFLYDQRYVTTIEKEDGSRATQTKASDKVINSVLRKGEEYFSDKTMVNEEKYFGYYIPIKDDNQKTIGMFFIGKPSVDVIAGIKNNIILVCIACLIIVVISIGIAFYYSHKIIDALNKIKIFLGVTARGDLTAKLEPELLERNDELGEMGNFAKMLQSSLTDLVGKDPLTGLHNRRSCNVVLQTLVEKSRKEGRNFAIAMGDIDLFKKINDTYGHQAGDMVLKRLSQIISNHMDHQGFVFRWGGEEFLLIYEDMDALQAYTQLEELQREIMKTEFIWNHSNIHISVTFGLSDSKRHQDVEKLIEAADAYLYYGKNEGRNCIIMYD